MGTNTVAAQGSTLKAYADKVGAEAREAKARLEQIEAKTRDKSAQAEGAVINSLKTAKQNIDRKLQDLKTTHASNVPSAKADIDADVARLKASIDELAARVKSQTAAR